MQQRYLTTADLAELLQIHAVTVRKWRRTGDGPRYSRLTHGGPVRYDMRDVEAWLAERRVANTAEESEAVRMTGER